MSLLFGAERRSVGADIFSDTAPGFTQYGGLSSMAGERVSFQTAIGLDAVAAGVGLLSDLVTDLPLHGYTDQGGVPTRLPDDPAIIAKPSLTTDPRTWRSQLMTSMLLWGNGYGLVMSRDRLGYPQAVEWLDPQRVQVVELSTIARDLSYSIDGQQIDPRDIIHQPGRYVRPGSRIGLVPLEVFRETYGLALAARNYGARWFGDGAHPSSILTTDQILNAETAQTVKDRFMAAMRGKRGPAVLGAGLKWSQVQTAPNESQFAETQNAAVVSVARCFGIPADMLDAAVAGKMTYANSEQRRLDFLTFSADPWLVRIEELVTSMMPRGKYAKFERGALLRTDAKTQAEVLDMKIRGGIITVAEARRLLDLPPVPAEGELLWPPYASAISATTAGAMP